MPMYDLSALAEPDVERMEKEIDVPRLIKALSNKDYCVRKAADALARQGWDYPPEGTRVTVSIDVEKFPEILKGPAPKSKETSTMYSPGSGPKSFRGDA